MGIDKHMFEVNSKLCYETAKKYGYRKEDADGCDGAVNILCPCCPFITK